MKRFKTTLIDTTYDYSLEEVNEMLEINECELAKDTDDVRYWDEVNRMREMDVEDFWDNVRYNKNYGKDCYCPVIVCGSCGCWNGRREIVPEKFDNLYDALVACSNNMYEIVVKQNCSKVEIKAMHHDGNNYFEIHFLNNRGIDAWDRWNCGYGNADLTNKIYHKTLTDYLW